DEHGRVDHELRTAAARAEYGIKVAERLACLLAKGGAGRLGSLRIDSGLTGDEQQVAGAHPRRIWADSCRDARARDDFTRRTHVLLLSLRWPTGAMLSCSRLLGSVGHGQ